MADSNSEPVICPCGFFGRPETAGLCSKCYRDNQQKKAAEAAPDKAAAASVSSEAFSKAVAQVTLPTSVSASASSTSNGSGLPSSTLAGAAAVTVSSSLTTTDTGATAAQPSNGTKRSRVDSQCDNALLTSTSGDTSKKKRDGDEESIASSTADDTMDQPASETSASDTSQSDKPGQKNKKRCFKCNCKLQPAMREIGRCKCDYIFCQLHRLPEQHDCIYDHKEKGRQEARDKMVSPKKHMGTSLKRIDSDS